MRGGWLLKLLPTARAKRLRIEAPSFLRDLEAWGVTEVHVRERFYGASADVARARALGILRATCGPTSSPGAIYVTVEQPHERRGGFVEASGDTTADWVGTFLGDPRQIDVLSKLRIAGTAEPTRSSSSPRSVLPRTA